jgi:threonine dehydratase
MTTHPDSPDYLAKILTASVYDVAIKSPLEKATNLSRRLKNDILLKREDLQPVFSFKLRGAYNKMAQLKKEDLERGVIAASAGNHAQGVALAAQKLNVKATIVMPTTTPSLKVDAVKSRGAEAVLYGDTYDDAYKHAKYLEEQQGSTFIHPFDDPDVIAGQGTIGMEILEQHQHKQKPIEAIFVAIGGGGLISGVAAYVKRLYPEIKIIGVEPYTACAMKQSLEAGKRVRLSQVGLFADGVAVREVGVETFRLCQEYVDEVILVNNDDICAAIKDVFEDTRSILEPAGALAIAGAKAYIEREGIENETLVTIACGANINFNRLRFVAERAELGERQEAMFAVTIPEKPGSFLTFCKHMKGRNVTEFNYRISNSKSAHILVGISILNSDDITDIQEQLETGGFKTLNLSDDELSKLHIRRAIGGNADCTKGELLYQLEFPERAGVLIKFLQGMYDTNPNWNISLFNYRNQGIDNASILIGIGVQVPSDDLHAWEDFLDSTEHPYTNCTDNLAYQLFLRNESANGE